jgi:IrrE N-terminal-like domain
MPSGNLYRAELRATQVLKALGITALPVDPFRIADSHSVEYREDPRFDSGFSGCLLRVGNAFGILYSARFSNEGFRRFTVAHELGHYFLEGHVQHLFGQGQGPHQSESGFSSEDKYEREADTFAASLPMPRELFEPACEQAGLGLKAIESLADLCNVSLTASGIRYAGYTRDPVAVVCSEGDRIHFAFMSTALKAIRGLTWLRKGVVIPRGTATRNFNEDPRNVASGRRLTAASSFELWFDGGGNTRLDEEVVGLGGYGRTLTVLSSECFPDSDDLANSEEDESEDLLPSQRWRDRG